MISRSTARPEGLRSRLPNFCCLWQHKNKWSGPLLLVPATSSMIRRREQCSSYGKQRLRGSFRVSLPDYKADFVVRCKRLLLLSSEGELTAASPVLVPARLPLAAGIRWEKLQTVHLGNSMKGQPQQEKGRVSQVHLITTWLLLFLHTTVWEQPKEVPQLRRPLVLRPLAPPPQVSTRVTAGVMQT